MREDIFTKMTEDTRALVQQMQAHAVPPPLNADPVQLARDGYRQTIGLAGPVEEVETVEDYKVSSVTYAIPLRVYRPQIEGSDTSLPALVYFHGGGFISGDFDTHDRPLQVLANTSGCVIAAVDYRLVQLGRSKLPAKVV